MGLTDNLLFILTMAGITFAGFLTIGLIIAKLYVRSTKEVAFVRTGMGERK